MRAEDAISAIERLGPQRPTAKEHAAIMKALAETPTAPKPKAAKPMRQAKPKAAEAEGATVATEEELAPGAPAPQGSGRWGDRACGVSAGRA